MREEKHFVRKYLPIYAVMAMGMLSSAARIAACCYMIYRHEIVFQKIPAMEHVLSEAQNTIKTNVCVMAQTFTKNYV